MNFSKHHGKTTRISNLRTPFFSLYNVGKKSSWCFQYHRDFEFEFWNISSVIYSSSLDIAALPRREFSSVSDITMFSLGVWHVKLNFNIWESTSGWIGQSLTTIQHTSDNAVMEVFASLGLLMSGCIDCNHCSLCSIGVEDQCDNLLGIEVASFTVKRLRKQRTSSKQYFDQDDMWRYRCLERIYVTLTIACMPYYVKK